MIKVIQYTAASKTAGYSDRLGTSFDGVVVLKQVETDPRKRHALVLRHDFLRFTWMCLTRQTSKTPCASERCLVDVRSELGVEALRTDNGGEFTSDNLVAVCDHNSIRHEFTNGNVPALNGMVGRGTARADKMKKAACIQAPITFATSGIPKHTEGLCEEALLLAVDCMNRRSSTSSLE